MATQSPARRSDRSAIVELRRYTMRPDRRNVLVELFERELIEPQEDAGMQVIGQFADLDDADRFVWLRGFTDMRTRRGALAAFYGGPVWHAHRAAANATMVDSDDVLLLRPARAGAAFVGGGERPPNGAEGGGRGAVAAGIAHLAGSSAEAAAVEVFESAIAPAITGGSGAVLGVFLTERSPNDFPALPVREGERVLAWFAGFADEATLDAAAGRIADAARAALGRSAREVEQLRLVPTPRSLLTGTAPPCPAYEGSAA